MDQEAGSAAVEGVVAKCPACGTVVKDFPWVPESRCPKCDSAELSPATIIEGAVDYSVADRRKGYAIEDIRFAKLAQWAGLVTPFQYNQTLAKMKAMADSGQEPPHIARWFVNAGIMKESDVKAVLEVYNKLRPSADDTEFARVAVQNNFAAEDRVEDLQIVQKKMRGEGAMVPPLAVLCFEKRLMPENKIVAILRAQRKRAAGPIHEVLDIIEANRPPTTIEKYIGRKGDPKRKYRAAGFMGAGVVLIIAWMWYYGLIGRAEYVGYHCNACNKNFMARRKKQLPVKCRYCREQAALFGFICGKCGTVYGDEQLDGIRYCPKCRSGLSDKITPEALRKLAEREKRRLRGREEKETLYELRKGVE